MTSIVIFGNDDKNKKLRDLLNQSSLQYDYYFNINTNIYFLNLFNHSKNAPHYTEQLIGCDIAIILYDETIDIKQLTQKINSSSIFETRIIVIDPSFNAPSIENIEYYQCELINKPIIVDIICNKQTQHHLTLSQAKSIICSRLGNYGSALQFRLFRNHHKRAHYIKRQVESLNDITQIRSILEDQISILEGIDITETLDHNTRWQTNEGLKNKPNNPQSSGYYRIVCECLDLISQENQILVDNPRPHT